MTRLAGKVAVITGAARGQGLAEAERFVAEGARVVMGDLLADEGRDAARAIGPDALFVDLDVTSAAAWDAALRQGAAHFGGIDVLVNNAGVDTRGAVHEISEAQWRALLDVNLVGPFLGISAVVPFLRARGGGSIINVSSLNGIAALRATAAYTASKFGVRGLTKAAALDLGPLRIRVNAILPGVVRTPMVAGVVAAHEDQLAAGLPVGRIGEPADIAGVAVFLASDDAGYLTGADIVADGGLSAGIPRLI